MSDSILEGESPSLLGGRNPFSQNQATDLGQRGGGEGFGEGGESITNSRCWGLLSIGVEVGKGAHKNQTTESGQIIDIFDASRFLIPTKMGLFRLNECHIPEVVKTAPATQTFMASILESVYKAEATISHSGASVWSKGASTFFRVGTTSPSSPVVSLQQLAHL